MSKRYIIKNCPAFCNNTCDPDDQWAIKDGCLKYDDYCIDNTCLLKRIVGLCKWAFERSNDTLAQTILLSLDIQEVE